MQRRCESLIASIDLDADPDLMPVVDALEDVHSRIVELQSAAYAVDSQRLFLDGVAAAVGLPGDSP